MKRGTFMFLGIVAIGTGGLSILAGRTHYSNYWGAPVFAPFAIAIGILSLVAAFTHRNKQG